MNLNQRQFTYLQTMGISLWQRKGNFFAEPEAAASQVVDNQVNAEKVTVEPTANTVQNDTGNKSFDTKSKDNLSQVEPITQPPIDIEKALKQQLLVDVAIVLNIAIEDCSLIDQGIQLGPIEWHILNTEQVTCKGNTLITPDFDVIANSTRLKAQLWSCLVTIVNNSSPA